MLQQTRVDTVIPYFERWMNRFPSVHELAAADLQDVLKVWEGLGYYSRARNLHKAARQILEVHGGKVPADPEALKTLPGIGPYTQAAILSLAFNQRFAVLDGNVERVLTRLTAWEADVRRPAVKGGLRELATRLQQGHPPGEWNEAMMELGAVICTPRQPRCTECPLQRICRGRRQDKVSRLPFKSPRKPIPTIRVGAGVLWRDRESFLVARRHASGMLGGLWEFPGGKLEPGESMTACVRRELLEELGVDPEVGERLVHVRHTYSHFHLRMDVHHCRWQGDPPKTLDCADFRWVRHADCALLPFSKADLKVLDALQGVQSPFS
jgi:A/G-specific adenine glycosylase